MVTDRMCIIRYEKKIIFFYIMIIKYGTHDTEKKKQQKIFLELQF